jgi:O-antigen biosynthesis protein
MIERVKRGLKHWNRRRLEARRKRKQPTYSQWISQFDTPDTNIRAEWTKRLSELGKTAAPPKLYVLIPLDGQTQELQLKRSLDSLCSQVAGGIRLVLIEPHGGLPKEMGSMVEAIKCRDPLFDFHRVLPGTTESQSEALDLALQRLNDLDWHTTLFPGDVLAPQATLIVQEALERWPEAELIYADEDQLDADGSRVRPHFKPDWNPEMLLSTDWLGRAVWIPRKALTRVGRV